MAKLLVIDPLDLKLESENGEINWTSRSCFERCLSEMEGILFEYVSGKDGNLCKRALAADAVILGGSEASAWEDTAFNDQLLDLIAICKNNEIPLLAICFGAQLLGRALGGEVSRHPKGIELGAPAIRISEKGKRSPLFSGMNTGRFSSIETHRDAVLTLPPGCELLASTEHTPAQAFTFEGLLTGVQFHPEMDGEDLRSLWKAFEQAGIIDSIPEEIEKQLADVQCERRAGILQNFAAACTNSFQRIGIDS